MSLEEVRARHNPSPDHLYILYCDHDGELWPCDASLALDRIARLEAALRNLVEGIDLAVADDNDSDPLYDHLSPDLAGYVDVARAALDELG